MSTALRRRPHPSPPPLPSPVDRIVARVRRAWRLSTLVRGLAVAPALLAASAVLLIASDLLMPMR
ncbi:MAG TPA: hypothetical protein VGO40_18425, partial [Longimicrobium sp.]|nr:hypothetical protein [Longimicrobium sp.]